jgi:hypothetical protein
MNFDIPKPGMPIYLEVGERKLELRYSLKTLKALDADLGISVLKGDTLVAALRDPAILTDLLWYGLRSKNPDITRDWVEEEFDASMLLNLIPLLGYAITGHNASNALHIVPNGREPVLKPGSTYGLSGDTISDSPSANSGI